MSDSFVHHQLAITGTMISLKPRPSAYSTIIWYNLVHARLVSLATPLQEGLHVYSELSWLNKENI